MIGKYERDEAVRSIEASKKIAQAALKSVYLAVMNIQKKWTMSIRNWGTVLNQFIIIFENRCGL